jgi:mRNA interferase YafQ
MRTIERTSAFKNDYKREKKGRHRETLAADLEELLLLLASDKALPERYRDHALAGKWKAFRDCHLKPDLVLIYRKTDPQPQPKRKKLSARPAEAGKLELVRLGSHSELF